MYPTLEKGDVVVISKLGYKIFGIEYKDPVPEDIIAFKLQGELLIKRIYKIDDTEGIFVLGDNSLNSTDSREFGYITPSTIEGRAIMKLNFKEFTFSFID